MGYIKFTVASILAVMVSLLSEKVPSMNDSHRYTPASSRLVFLTDSIPLSQDSLNRKKSPVPLRQRPGFVRFQEVSQRVLRIVHYVLVVVSVVIILILLYYLIRYLPR